VRIAYVSADRGVAPTGSNGASTHIRELVNAVVARGVEVKVLTARPGDGRGIDAELIDIDTDDVLPALRRLTAGLDGGNDAAATQASEVHGLLLNECLHEHLEGLHARWPIDLVYERYSLWSHAGFRFARHHRLPFLLEVNAPLAAQQEEYRRLSNAATAHALEHLLLSRADRVIVPARVLSEYVQSRGCPARRIRVIPCGVGPQFFDCEVRPDQGPTDGDFVIGFLGSLKPWHGLETLLEAFGRLLAQDPGYRLLVVGDGPLRATVERFASACGRPDRVTITGAVAHHEVPAYLARMDVGVAPYPVLPTFYFSPLKIFEYAAARVPIVASGSGQIAELLVHRKSALLHVPGNVDEMVQHIERLRGNAELRTRLARRARRIARGYTWDRLAARFLAAARAACRRPGDASGASLELTALRPDGAS